jgi:hypothetical protein
MSAMCQFYANIILFWLLCLYDTFCFVVGILFYFTIRRQIVIMYVYWVQSDMSYVHNVEWLNQANGNIIGFVVTTFGI